jgi:hypothetical protein
MREVYKCESCEDFVLVGTETHILPHEALGVELAPKKTCDACTRALRSDRMRLS